MRSLVGLIALAAAIATSDTWACGACLEDKVAATYDYAVIQRARANGDVVVFCDIRGSVAPDRLRAAARVVKGLDVASVRISREPPALSFALDSARQSPEEAAAALERAAPGAHVNIVRLIR